MLYDANSGKKEFGSGARVEGGGEVKPDEKEIKGGAGWETEKETKHTQKKTEEQEQIEKVKTELDRKAGIQLELGENNALETGEHTSNSEQAKNLENILNDHGDFDPDKLMQSLMEK